MGSLGGLRGIKTSTGGWVHNSILYTESHALGWSFSSSNTNLYIEPFYLTIISICLCLSSFASIRLYFSPNQPFLKHRLSNPGSNTTLYNEPFRLSTYFHFPPVLSISLHFSPFLHFSITPFLPLSPLSIFHLQPFLKLSRFPWTLTLPPR